MGAEVNGRWSYSRYEQVLQTQASLRARRQARDVAARHRPRPTPGVEAVDAGMHVADCLDALPHPWRTIHRIDADAGVRLASIAIGPPGVFSVTTLQTAGPTTVHDRAIVIDDRATDTVNQARRAADLASRRLTRALGRAVPVTPAVAVVGAAAEHVGAPRAMVVTDVAALAAALRTHAPARYGSPEITELVRTATSPAMWALR